MFSARSRFEHTANALARTQAQLAAARVPICDLTCHNPSALGLSWDAKVLAASLSQPGVAHYTPEPFGLYETREMLASALRMDGHPVDARHVMLTASTSEAYGYLFKLLCDPGDRVLVPAPSYPLFDVLAALEGVELVSYSLAYDGGWHVADDLSALVENSKARAIVVVHPNNPTGSFLKCHELSTIEATGLPIVSDEVFCEYAHRSDPERVRSALDARASLVFRLSGASKSLALPQLKLAWTVLQGPAALRDEACARLEHIADSYLSPSTAAQLALPVLWRERAAMQRAITRRCALNLSFLKDAFEHTALSLLDVEGGWSAIVRLPAVMDEEAWVLTLLQRDQVLVQPGYFFELGSGTHIVISLLTDPAVLREGIARVLARVATADEPH
jgi:aspartate/methionine/tyrosine aminotransferase